MNTEKRGNQAAPQSESTDTRKPSKAKVLPPIPSLGTISFQGYLSAVERHPLGFSFDIRPEDEAEFRAFIDGS